MLPTEPIRPLHDVWLRPRRVFRELAQHPIGAADYILGATQGMALWLALSREQNAGATQSLAQIFGKALFLGSIGGILNLIVMGAIYARLYGRRPASRDQVVHVLAFGGVPISVSLGLWLVTALLAGDSTFMEVPRPDLETFLALLLRAQFAAYVFLMIWSIVLQVMGFSEIRGLSTRRAFGIWVMGQLLGALAFVCLLVLIMLMLPET